jgi:hypothetical protein
MDAVVIGNGESRRVIDLNQLKNHFTLIGCNALHRDITVDHLICCDRRMADEAVNNPNTAETLIYVREDWHHYFRKIRKNKNIRTVPDLPYTGEHKQDQPEHWGSGGYAILLAASLGIENIYVLGFDLYPYRNKVNNIYKGTQHYSKQEANPVDYSYWIYQISKIFKYFPKTNFFIVNDPEWKIPQEWQNKNVSLKIISEFPLTLNTEIV